jgi:hypothetical protein
MRSRKNISRPLPSLFDPVAVRCGLPRWISQPLRLISQSAPDLAVVDKSQVFALNLIRRKSAKNPTDLIRRKFSIDGGIPPSNGVRAASTISKPYRFRRGNPSFTIRID